MTIKIVEFNSTNKYVLEHPSFNDFLIYDIETYSPKGYDLRYQFDEYVKDAECTYIGIYSYKYKKYKMYYKDHFDAAREAFKDHKIHIGFNNKFFDGVVLKNNKNKFYDELEYKIVIDLLQVLYDTKRRKDNKAVLIETPEGIPLSHATKRYRLKDVCKALEFPVEKEDINYKLFGKKIEDLTIDERNKIYYYLYRDVELTRMLFEKIIETFEPYTHGVNRPTSVSHENIKKLDYIRSSLGSYTYQSICHEAGIPVIWDDNADQMEKPVNHGGFVKAPTREINTKPGHRYFYKDFSSLYPSIYIQCNLFSKATSEEIENGEFWNGDNFFEVNGKYKVNERGVIENILVKWFNERQELKAKKDPRQKPLKVKMNTLYGITGSRAYAQLCDDYTSGDCTSIGRKCIQYSAEIYESNGFEVIYGDTDSCFVVLPPDRSEQELEKIDKQIIETIWSHMPFPFDKFKLDTDDVFKKLWLFGKKFYIGINEKDRLVVKGLPIIRSDSTMLGSKIFDIIKPIILEKGDIKFDKVFFYNLIHEMIEEDISLIGQTYNVRDPKDYASGNHLHLQIAEEYGEGEHFLIKNNLIGKIGKQFKYATRDESKDLKPRHLVLNKVWKELDPFIKAEFVQTDLSAF